MVTYFSVVFKVNITLTEIAYVYGGNWIRLYLKTSPFLKIGCDFSVIGYCWADFGNNDYADSEDQINQWK